MAARWKLVQSFIREATEDSSGQLVPDVQTVYAKLRAIQRGAFAAGTAENGLVQIHSKIGETEFSFSIPEGLSPADIMETVETALQLIERESSVAAIRKVCLQRTKAKLGDYRTLGLC